MSRTIKLTDKQFAIVLEALYEYGEICATGCEIAFDTETTKYKQDKRSPLYRVSKDCFKLHEKLANQPHKIIKR